MTADDPNETLKAELAQLRDEHRKLDGQIKVLEESPASDRIALQRMKKRKLALKDRMAQIEDALYPDIIA